MVPSVQLSDNGPFFSRLVAGVMTWGQWGKKLDANGMLALMETCLSLGITTFDHADIYGDYTTEAEFGAALAGKSHLRTQMQLVSKCGIKLISANRPGHRVKSYDTSKAHIVASTEASLRQLRTDYLDLLLIHRPDPLMDPHEIAEAIATLKEQGKILHFGVSNFTPNQVKLLRQLTPVATNQIECSLLHRQPFWDGTLDQCLRLHMRPMAWSPLGGSRYFSALHDDSAPTRLTAKLSEMADGREDVLMLAWLLKHPSGILPVLGTTRPERLKAATTALDFPLSREDWFDLMEAASGKPVA